MIFSTELARLVRRGRKTQTRRVAVVGKRRFYTEGRTYAIQDRRGGKAMGRIRIIHIDKQPLRDINHSEAVAEGFAGRADFALYWLRLHGFGLGWACALTDRDEDLPVMAQADEMVLARLEELHGHLNVWVYTFRLDDDPPQLLARTGHTAPRAAQDDELAGRRADRGYTMSPSEALDDEPEPVDDEALNDIVSGAMDRRRVLRAEEDQKKLVRTLAERMKEQTAQSRRRGVDVSPMLERIREELDRMQDELGRAA